MAQLQHVRCLGPELVRPERPLLHVVVVRGPFFNRRSCEVKRRSGHRWADEDGNICRYPLLPPPASLLAALPMRKCLFHRLVAPKRCINRARGATSPPLLPLSPLLQEIVGIF